MSDFFQIYDAIRNGKSLFDFELAVDDLSLFLEALAQRSEDDFLEAVGRGVELPPEDVIHEMIRWAFRHGQVKVLRFFKSKGMLDPWLLTRLFDNEFGGKYFTPESLCDGMSDATVAGVVEVLQNGVECSPSIKSKFVEGLRVLEANRVRLDVDIAHYKTILQALQKK